MGEKPIFPNLDLERRALRLETRDWQLWSICFLIALVLAAGFAALVLPNVFWPVGTIIADRRYLPQLIFGFIVLVVLFNIYALQQRRLLRLTREELIRELIQRQAAEKLSLVDPLTGTYNRRYMDEIIGRDLSRIERQGTPVTFLMIDVDKFKTVNTRFGHLMGDRILAEVAQVLRKTFRAADTIIRYGGDEFLVMLDGCDENQASLAVSRLQQEVVEWNRQKLVPAYEMKLSCGIGRYTKGARIAEVLDIADRAMYAAKTGTVAPDSTVTNLPRQ